MADDQKETNSKLTEVNRKLAEISSKLGNVTDATNENTKEQKKRGPRGPYAKDGAKTAERTADAAEKTAEEAKKEGKKSSSKESRERALLGQSQKQYEETVKQRELAAEAKKEMANIGSAIKGDAKNNKQYQEAEKKFNKEQSKAQKLEGRRNLLSRFKDTKEKGGTGAAVKELGGTATELVGKTFKSIGGFLGKFSKIFSLLVIPALVLLVNSPAWDWLQDFAKSIVKFFSSEGPLGSFLKPILEFFRVGGSFDGVMTGIQVGFGTLVAGLAAAVVFAPFKVMGGIAKLGLFIGKKLFGLVTSVTKALLPKKAVASATKGAAKGAAGATAGATKGAAGAAKGVAAAAAPAGGSASKPPKVPKAPKAPKINPAKTLAKIGSKFGNIGKLLKIVGKAVPGLGLLLAGAEGISILMSDASKEEKIKQLSGLLGGTMAAAVMGFGGAALGTLMLPGIGTIVGGGLGAIAGYFGGDYVGQKLAGWMLGDEVEKDLTPKPAASAGAAAKAPAGSPMQKMGIAEGSMAASGMDLGDVADDISTSRVGKRQAKSGMLGGRRVGIGARDIGVRDAKRSAAGRIRGARRSVQRDEMMAAGQLEMDDFGGPGLDTLSPEKRIANAKRITDNEAAAKKTAPPPNIISSPTTVNNTNPTSNNTSNSPSLKPSGSAGIYAGSMTNAGFM